MRLLREGICTTNPSSAKPEPKAPEKFVLPEDKKAEAMIKIEGMTTNELIDMCFQGIDLKTYDGTPFTRTMLAVSLNSAIETAEQLFDIAITPQVIENEVHDYEGSSIWNYQYTPLYKRPVKQVYEMKYMLGNRELLEIPEEWITLDKKVGDLTIIPTSMTGGLIMPAFGGSVPFFMYRNYVPMGVRISYLAGMDKEDIPANLLEWIYKKASISIFQVWGDQIIGAGIASSSLSIDGLSQSIGTTQSAMFGGASARINDYRKDIEDLTPIIRKHFSRFDSVVL